MVQRYHGHHREHPLHLLHIVAMVLTMVQDDGATTIDAIEMVDGKEEAERVVAMSTPLETQVRPVSLHLTCNCGGAVVNSTYRQCLVSMRNSTAYFTALTLFDTGAYTSFVNRDVAKWLELQQHGGTVAWSEPCSIQQTRCTYIGGRPSRHAIK